MTKIYLIRHGESEWNKLSMIQGQQNTKLTELGKIQAKRLGARLIEEKVDLIYTSDLERAYMTGKIIAEEIQKPLIVAEALREIKFGPWEGLALTEIKEKFKDEYGLWMREPHNLTMEGAERLEDLKTRSMQFINELVESNKGKNIGIVSHSATLKTILLGLLGLETSFYKNFTLKNVSLSIVECRSINNVLTLLNDISHLKGL